MVFRSFFAGVSLYHGDNGAVAELAVILQLFGAENHIGIVDHLLCKAGYRGCGVQYLDLCVSRHILTAIYLFNFFTE